MAEKGRYVTLVTNRSALLLLEIAKIMPEKLISVLCTILIFINTSIEAAQNECPCGLTNPSRIIGGKETAVNEFPFIAAIIYTPRKVPYCGGTIITIKHVLTAARCVYGFPVQHLEIVVPEHDLSTGDEIYSHHLEVESSIKHPRYSYYTFENDVGIFTVKGQIDYSTKVRPTCLPYFYTDRDFVGETLTAVGWGGTGTLSGAHKTLQKVDIEVVPLKQCTAVNNYTSVNMMCTYGQNKKHCMHDAGGPLLYRNKTSNTMIQVGLLSYGYECQENTPNLNMFLPYYLDFIECYTKDYKICKMY